MLTEMHLFAPSFVSTTVTTCWVLFSAADFFSYSRFDISFGFILKRKLITFYVTQVVEPECEAIYREMISEQKRLYAQRFYS
jgi:hypothetical protein